MELKVRSPELMYVLSSVQTFLRLCFFYGGFRLLSYFELPR